MFSLKRVDFFNTKIQKRLLRFSTFFVSSFNYVDVVLFQFRFTSSRLHPFPRPFYFHVTFALGSLVFLFLLSFALGS